MATKKELESNLRREMRYRSSMQSSLAKLRKALNCAAADSALIRLAADQIERDPLGAGRTSFPRAWWRAVFERPSTRGEIKKARG